MRLIDGATTKSKMTFDLGPHSLPMILCRGEVLPLLTTTEDDLRAYLIDCGVFNDIIADVMKLRSHSTRASSFCVSLCNTEVESMIYVPSKWPEGTRIRPFKQKSPRSSKRIPNPCSTQNLPDLKIPLGKDPSQHSEVPQSLTLSEEMILKQK